MSVLDENKEFWEERHINNDRYWLTNSAPDYVYRLHGLTTDLMESGKRVLEVGVGYGRSIIELSRLHQVYAIDVSERALDKAIDYAMVIQTYEENRWPVGIIDIALCHLVFQHCDDYNIRYLMQRVIKSLKVTGYFSFQSAYVDESNLNDSYKSYMNAGHMFFRSKSNIIDIVKESGGEIISISSDILHPNECNIVWNIYKVIKASG